VLWVLLGILAALNPNPGGLVANMTFLNKKNYRDKFIIHKKNWKNF
jgi:hypothetical protein